MRYLAQEAVRLREAGRAVGKDGAGEWRRMATSPLPLGVVEFPVIRRLLDEGTWSSPPVEAARRCIRTRSSA